MSIKAWLNIHSCVAMFFLPLALLYAVTGGIATVETREHHGFRGHRYGAPATLVQNNPDSNEEPWEGEGVYGKHPGLYARLQRLHEADCGIAFKILGIAFAAGLITIYLSGIWICWANRTMRRQMLIFGFTGLVVTAVAAWMSL